MDYKTLSDYVSQNDIISIGERISIPESIKSLSGTNVLFPVRSNNRYFLCAPSDKTPNLSSKPTLYNLAVITELKEEDFNKANTKEGISEEDIADIFNVNIKHHIILREPKTVDEVIETIYKILKLPPLKIAYGVSGSENKIFLYNGKPRYEGDDDIGRTYFTLTIPHCHENNLLAHKSDEFEIQGGALTRISKKDIIEITKALWGNN